MTKKLKNWNHLSILTKDEIIEYLNQNYGFQVSDSLYSDVRFFKWDKLMREYHKKMDLYLKDEKPLDWAGKADDLAKKFNNETDSSKKLEYLKQRDVYIKKLKKYHDEYMKLDNEYKMIEEKYGRRS